MTSKNRNPFSAAADQSPAPPADGSTASSNGMVGSADQASGTGGSPSPAGGSGGDAANYGRIRAFIDPEQDLRCCRLPLTDLGNAERWRIRYGRDFRFCAEIGWFAWDGMRWALLSEEKDQIPARVMGTIMLSVRAIRNEASLVAASGYEPLHGLSEKEAIQLERFCEAFGAANRATYLRGDDDGSRAEWLENLDPLDEVLDASKGTLWSSKIAAWAKSSEAGGMPGRMMKWIKGFEDINIGPTEMDADGMAINVLNGTLRLKRKNRKRTEEEKQDWLARHRAEGAQGRPAARSGPAGSAEGGAGGGSREERGADAPRTDIEAPEWTTEWQIVKEPHRREDLISKLAPVKYSRAAKCDTYDAFMARVQPDEHMRRFIHQWGGISITGDTTVHKMAFFYGGGRNGKGTWVEAVAALAGDYAGTVQFESLADTGGKRRGDQATPDLAELPGVRFLRVAEPSAGVKFDDGLVKQMTGGDPLKVRLLHKGFFQFFPDFKITISGNNKPNVRDTSHGFWARMQLVPWTVTIPEEEIDSELPAKLRSEASGILNRLLEGLLDWRNNGLIVPEAVRMATHAYRDQSDDLGRFLAQCCWVSDGDTTLRVGAKELFDVFEAWADQTGGAKWTMKGLKKALEDRGFEQKQSNGMKWLRIELRPGVTVEGVKAGDIPDPDDGPPELDDEAPAGM